MTPRELVHQTRSRIESVANVVRRIIGVPDYDRYVAHVQAHHPGVEPMCRRDFERQRVLDKYSRPGGRCC